MRKIDPLALTAGIILTVAGVVVLIVGIFFPFALIYGTILLVLGVIILVTLRQQEYIEPIKTKRNK